MTYRKKAKELLEKCEFRLYHIDDVYGPELAIGVLETALREVANEAYEKAAEIAEKYDGCDCTTRVMIATQLREEIKK